jgi:hypothetical protein
MQSHSRLWITTQTAECYWSEESSPLIRWQSLEKQIRGTEIKAQVQTVQYFNNMSHRQHLSSTSGEHEFENPTSLEKNKHGFLLKIFVLH